MAMFSMHDQTTNTGVHTTLVNIHDLPSMKSSSNRRRRRRRRRKKKQGFSLFDWCGIQSCNAIPISYVFACLVAMRPYTHACPNHAHSMVSKLPFNGLSLFFQHEQFNRTARVAPSFEREHRGYACVQHWNRWLCENGHRACDTGCEQCKGRSTSHTTHLRDSRYGL